EPNSVVSGRPLPEKPPKPARGAAKTTTSTARRTRAAKSTGASADWPDDAPRAALPALLEPELATLVAAPPEGDDWGYEIKFDGYRILARIDGDDVRLVTRNGNDWTTKLGAIADELRARRVEPCWIGGEIVVLDAQGASD